MDKAIGTLAKHCTHRSGSPSRTPPEGQVTDGRTVLVAHQQGVFSVRDIPRSALGKVYPFERLWILLSYALFAIGRLPHSFNLLSLAFMHRKLACTSAKTRFREPSLTIISLQTFSMSCCGHIGVLQHNPTPSLLLRKGTPASLSFDSLLSELPQQKAAASARHCQRNWWIGRSAFVSWGPARSA